MALSQILTHCSIPYMEGRRGGMFGYNNGKYKEIWVNGYRFIAKE